MRTLPNLPRLPSLRVALLLFLLIAVGGPAKAGSFTWSSPQSSGSWSSVSAWTPAPGSGGPGVNDTANLIDTGGANRVVTYDSQASGTVGALNFTETSAGTNTLLLQGGDSNFADLAPLVLGSSGHGVSELRMISNGLSITGSAPLLTINAGGLLTLSPGNTNANAAQLNGPVTLSGGLINVIQGASGSEAKEYLNNTLTMTGGTISLYGSGGSDTRLHVGNNFIGTGGLIMMAGSGSGNVGTFFLDGTTNQFNGVLLDSHVQIMMEGTNNQDLTVTTGTLNTLIVRSGFSATITSNVTGPNVGQLQWGNSAASGTTDVILGSNLTLTAGGGLPSANYGEASNNIQTCMLDLGGYTLDLTSSTGAWAPTFDVVLDSGTNWELWDLQTSQPRGTIKASGFDFHGAFEVIVGPGLTLQAIGASGTINLSGNTIIDPASTLLYTGTANSTLTATGNTVGNVVVNSGTLTLGSNITTGSNSQVTVDSGADLVLGDFDLTVPNGKFSLGPGATLTVNLTGTGSGQFGQIAVSGTISVGGTLIVSATASVPVGTSITVLSNSSGAAIQGTFNGLPEGTVFTAGGNMWKITYAGGSGGSVEITAVGTVIAMVNPGGAVQAVPRGFAGFSHELTGISGWSGTAPPGAFNYGLANFMMQLARLEGPPVIRIGGNSQDKSWYQATPAAAAPTFYYYNAPTLNAIQPSDLQSLAWLSSVTGCNFTFGLNFGGDNPAAAVAEVAGALSAFPSNSIMAFDIGNEPDNFGGGYRNSSWDAAAFQSDLSSFISQVLASYPSIPLAAPAYAGTGWLPTSDTSAFDNLLGAIGNRISFVTLHHYSFDGLSPPSKAVQVLLSSTDTTAIGPEYGPTLNASASYGLQVRMNETNSAYGGGDPGVSNAMAGGLWITNILGVYALQGFSGANFHGGSTDAYDPFTITTSGTTFSTLATPVYYGMYFFAQFIQNNAGLLPLSSYYSSNTVACYASRDSGGSLRILVLNKDGSNTLSGSLLVTNTSGYNASGTFGIFETSQSVPLSATNGMTVDGQSFDTNGNLTGTPVLTAVPGSTIGSGTASYAITLPPGSAGIFTLDQAVPVNPTVALDSTNQSVSAGSPVEFTATAMGAAPFTYQWLQNGTAIPGANNPRLFIASAGLANTGTYSVVVTNPAGSVTGNANLAVVPSFGYWQSTYFTAAQLDEPAVSGDTADPEGDGISNLMKYALNLDPWTNGFGGLPAGSIITTGNSKYPAITYTELLLAPDITYTVQVSTDLQTWNFGPAYTKQTSAIDNPGGETETVTAQSILPLSGTTPQFIRLQVTAQ